MRGVTEQQQNTIKRIIFLLTRLMRGVTYVCFGRASGCRISTHTPHARRDERIGIDGEQYEISTHTPHARRDTQRECRAAGYWNFYSHASCEA